MKHFAKYILLLTIVMLSHEERVTIPAGFCDMFVMREITGLHLDVNSIDGSYFTAVVLPGTYDSCPITIEYNMIRDCDDVLNCSADLYKLQGDYSVFIINDNIIEDGRFDIVMEAAEPLVFYVIYVFIFMGICSCCGCSFLCLCFIMRKYGRNNNINITNIELAQLPSDMKV